MWHLVSYALVIAIESALEPLSAALFGLYLLSTCTVPRALTAVSTAAPASVLSWSARDATASFDFAAQSLLPRASASCDAAAATCSSVKALSQRFGQCVSHLLRTQSVRAASCASKMTANCDS